jgi:hypothetical protein
LLAEKLVHSFEESGEAALSSVKPLKCLKIPPLRLLRLENPPIVFIAILPICQDITILPWVF